MEEGYPINVLNAVKNVPEVAHIYAAGANPMQVIVAKTDMGTLFLEWLMVFLHLVLKTRKP